MGRLGVPSAKDLAALSERVEKLAAEVGRLGGKAAPAKKAAPRAAAKKAPRKTAA